jgi:RNA polymerase sigma-70 factor (ECF subfamily)
MERALLLGGCSMATVSTTNLWPIMMGKLTNEERVQQENEWVRRIKKDDREAFEALYRLYYPKLSQFALRYVDSRQSAEDVVHEVFYNVWTARDRLQPQGTLRGYLYSAVRNQSLTYLNERDVKRFTNSDELLQLESLDTGPIDQLSTEELRQAISDALDLIPERRRRIFLMHREDGLTYREIADVLGISVKTVETQMSRSLKFLRQKLADFLPVLLFFCFAGILSITILFLL